MVRALRSGKASKATVRLYEDLAATELQEDSDIGNIRVLVRREGTDVTFHTVSAEEGVLEEVDRAIEGKRLKMRHHTLPIPDEDDIPALEAMAAKLGGVPQLGPGPELDQELGEELDDSVVAEVDAVEVETR